MWVGWFCSTFQQSPWVSSPGAHWEINFQPACVHVMTHCSRLQTTTKTELKGTVHLPSSSSFLLSLSLWLSLAEDAERNVMKDMEGDKGRLYWSDSVLKLEVIHTISLVCYELDIFVLSFFLLTHFLLIGFIFWNFWVKFGTAGSDPHGVWGRVEFHWTVSSIPGPAPAILPG